MSWPRTPRARRTFADWFYTRGQQRRLAKNRVGRGVLKYIDTTGRMVYPPDQRRHREDLATAHPYEPRHRR